MAVDPTMKVLIVDDYKTMLGILTSLMRQLNFSDIATATDGSMALEMLRKESFGLVISDWNMDPMSGIDLLREVRADESLKDIPFVMMTAETTTEKVAAAEAAGVSSYIVKPFNAAALKGTLVGVLGEF